MRLLAAIALAIAPLSLAAYCALCRSQRSQVGSDAVGSERPQARGFFTDEELLEQIRRDIVAQAQERSALGGCP